MEGIVTTLALLACPVGMGLMMLFMGRGLLGQRSSDGEPSLSEMRTEQQRLAADIERLGPDGETPDDVPAARGRGVAGRGDARRSS